MKKEIKKDLDVRLGKCDDPELQKKGYCFFAEHEEQVPSAKVSRKPINVSSYTDDNNNFLFTVICDDGSIWFGSYLFDEDDVSWSQLANIPQDE